MKQRINKLVKELIQEYLGSSRPISDNDTIYGRGADSLDLVEMVIGIEDELLIEIPDDDAEKFGNMRVKDLVEKIYTITQTPAAAAAITPSKDTKMSSKKAERTFVVRGFNVHQENFSNPVGVIEDKSTFKEVVVNTQAEAIIALLTDLNIGTMSANNLLDGGTVAKLVGESEFLNANDSKNVLQVIDLKIALGLTDKLEVRGTKSALREVIKRWAEKSRNKGRRGFRSNAIKTPVFEYAFDETYAKVQVVLSNAIIYADDSADITPNSYTSMVDDLALLRKELNRQLGWKFKALSFNHNVFGKGEVL